VRKADGSSIGPLEGVRVLDLSRVLAGPWATQILGDYGAEVVKVERPGGGDDTRRWGPPYVKDAAGRDTTGRDTIRRLARWADVLVENFRPGGLARHGLDYESLKAVNPGLIYCSISGFGQTGPNRDRPGYDIMIQGFGGLMSITGEPDGEPMKVGVAIADIMCGMYAVTAILAALRHRDRTGEGQHIDISLADTQVAWLANQGLNYLVSGENPPRLGNGHPNIVPYQVFDHRGGQRRPVRPLLRQLRHGGAGPRRALRHQSGPRRQQEDAGAAHRRPTGRSRT